MALFISPHCIVDTDCIVLAHPVEGVGPDDGHYGIMYLLEVSGRKSRDYVNYPDEATRDFAFAALCAILREEEAGLEQFQRERAPFLDGDEGDRLP